MILTVATPFPGIVLGMLVKVNSPTDTLPLPVTFSVTQGSVSETRERLMSLDSYNWDVIINYVNILLPICKAIKLFKAKGKSGPHSAI